jgi:hypothetical protein
VQVVVDTNVAKVASRHAPQADEACVDACIQALAEIAGSGGLVIDESGEILNEYLLGLGHSGRPGAGEAFVKWVFDHQHQPACCIRVSITRRAQPGWREYEEVPDDPRLQTFDRNDQKFVAAARACSGTATILNAVDSDWCLAEVVLAGHGVRVHQLCPQHMPQRTPSPPATPAPRSRARPRR